MPCTSALLVAGSGPAVQQGGHCGDEPDAVDFHPPLREHSAGRVIVRPQEGYERAASGSLAEARPRHNNREHLQLCITAT